MSEQQNFGFGKFVPGFDFLQNLSTGTPQQQAAPNLSSWVAPTLNVEELDKRIGELKAVSFWLDQNAKALAATIQALELQRMTLATLRGMNFNLSEIASAFELPADSTVARGGKPEGGGPVDGSVTGAAKAAVAKARASKKGAAAAGGSVTAAPRGVVDPMQWWGALTTQFQEIAAGALRDAGTTAAVPAPMSAPTAKAGVAGKKATAGKAGGGKAGGRKSAVRSS